MGIQIGVHRGMLAAEILNIVDNAISDGCDAVIAHNSGSVIFPDNKHKFGEFRAELKGTINTFRGVASRKRVFSVHLPLHGGNTLLQRAVCCDLKDGTRPVLVP